MCRRDASLRKRVVSLERLILASASPRRQQLLSRIYNSFDSVPSGIDELTPSGMSPAETVECLAFQKAMAVWQRFPNAVVLGADTVIAIDGETLGKPENRSHAQKMLRRLSGRSHDVYTGVAIVSKHKSDVFHCKAAVDFWELRETEIAWYVQSDEPMDKAGAYGIQGIGAILVKRITGDFFTIVGLPISQTVRALENFAVYPSYAEDK
ncbi:MAG TPA: Maf family protein [Bacillales bacterium]|nr:Maf family protein [Bacillales bacterium]